MSRLKRLLAFGGLAGMLAALAFAAPAQATKVAGACVVFGEAKMVDKVDPTYGVRISGGKGEFTYSSLQTICVGLSKGAHEVHFMQAAARGVFVSQICGTAKAWGTVTAFLGPPKYVNMIRGKKFAIHFLGTWPAASTGMFFWHRTKALKFIDLKDNVLDQVTKWVDPWTKTKDEPKDWHPAGVIRLDYPTQKPLVVPTTTNCTKAMTVAGTVLVMAD